MDLKKIDSLILKSFRSDNTYQRIRYGRKKDKVAVVASTQAFLIDSKLFPFDIAILSKGTMLCADNFSMFEMSPEYSVAYRSGELKEDAKRTVVKIQNDNQYAWVDINLLKPFNKDCTFYINSPKSIVYIFEDEELVGLVCPVDIDK